MRINIKDSFLSLFLIYLIYKFFYIINKSSYDKYSIH